MEQHEIALKVILVLITLSICYVTLSNHLGSDSLLTQLVQGVLLVAFVYVTGTIWAVSTTDAPNGIEWQTAEAHNALLAKTKETLHSKLVDFGIDRENRLKYMKLVELSDRVLDLNSRLRLRDEIQAPERNK